MALRNIIRDDDPGLSKVSRTVTDFNERLHMLLDDMHETLMNANGLGLAAPQVGVLRRAVLVAVVPETDDIEEIDTFEEDIQDVSEEPRGYEYEIVEMINPEIVNKDGEQCGREGCLSLPGIFGLVKRPQTVRVKAQDRFGKPFEIEVCGMTARAVCHETDHLDGIVFTSIAERLLTDEELKEQD